MNIERAPGVLSITFDHPKVAKLVYDRDGNCSVHDSKGLIISRFSTVCDVVYNGQYGTPISLDGKFVFIGTWRNGLFCYEIETGALLWKKWPSKIRRIVVSDTSVIAAMDGRGIFKRNISDGEKVDEIKMSGIESLFQLNKKELFAGPKHNKYFIFRVPSLEVIRTIKASNININNCLSFILLDVFYDNNDLVFKGWEQYKNRDYRNDEQIWFERTEE